MKAMTPEEDGSGNAYEHVMNSYNVHTASSVFSSFSQYSIESCQKMRYKADYKPTQILCPKYYSWVDASVAISKLQMTPRHVCPLTEPQPTTCNEEKESDGIETRKAVTNNGVSTQDDVAKALNLLQMDVGAGMNVTIDMLHPNGVEVVKPILKEFVLEFSPRLSKKCVLKLN